MRIKWVMFSFGILLFLVSLPMATIMIAELLHSSIMDSRYEINHVNEGYPATPASFEFHDVTIELIEELSDEEAYIDPWRYKLGFGHIALHVNGNEIDRLENFPIRIEEEGLNRYWGEVSFLTLTHKKIDETEFIILMKKTREIIKETPDKSIVGFAPDEDLFYSFYSVDKKGNLENDSFNFMERDALQTELLNASSLYSHQIGYYTDAWQGYPSLLFPFVYPFISLILGIFLIVTFRPKKISLRNKSV
ncbi:hypothetical protein [Oceanobacillus sp. CAU 1775]